MSLMKPFNALSNRWVEEQQKTNPAVSLKTLAVRALGDAKTYDRIAAGGSIAVPTYEKVIAFLDTPSNWPAGMIPDDVLRSLMMLRSAALAA